MSRLSCSTPRFSLFASIPAATPPVPDIGVQGCRGSYHFPLGFNLFKPLRRHFPVSRRARFVVRTHAAKSATAVQTDDRPFPPSLRERTARRSTLCKRRWAERLPRNRTLGLFPQTAAREHK